MAEITKNVFTNGMIKDLSPTNTSLTFLTDALNATLVTNNGNEMSLQNDMGNTTLKNLNLPHGYSVVGTTEYGGVVYVLSVNPETNYCQIGSYPSPEYIFNDKDDTNTILCVVNDFNDDNNFTKTVSITRSFTENYTLNPGDAFWYDVSENSNLEGITVTPVLIKDDGSSVPLEAPEGNNFKYISSKLSGKLALKFDLETVDNFQVRVNISEDKDNYIINLEADGCDNYITYLNGESKGKDYKKYEVPKDNKSILEFKCYPILKCGLYYKQMEVINSIDLSKVNSNEYKVVKWKYYTFDTTTMLDMGLELYPKLQYRVSKVTLSFYDNLGFLAIYSIDNYESYFGDYELTLPLNGSIEISELTSGNASSHKGELVYDKVNGIDNLIGDNEERQYLTESGSLEYVKKSLSGEINTSYTKLYKNNIGTITGSHLYGVKIDIYIEEDVEKPSTETLVSTTYKWLFTNGALNDYYYDLSVSDFNALEIKLVPDISTDYSIDSKENSSPTFNYKTESNEFLKYTDSNLSKNYYLVINNTLFDVKPSVKYDALHVGLYENYNSFHFVDQFDKIYNISYYINKKYEVPQLNDLSVSSHDSLTIASNAILDSPEIKIEISGTSSSQQINYLTTGDLNVNTNDLISDKVSIKIDFITYLNMLLSLPTQTRTVISPVYNISEANNMMKEFGSIRLGKNDYVYNFFSISSGNHYFTFLSTQNINNFTTSYNDTDKTGKRFVSCYGSNLGSGYSGLESVIKTVDRHTLTYNAKDSLANVGFILVHPSAVVYKAPSSFETGISLLNYKLTDKSNDNFGDIAEIDFSKKPPYFLAMHDTAGNIHIINHCFDDKNLKTFDTDLFAMLTQIYRVSGTDEKDGISRQIFLDKINRNITLDFITHVESNNAENYIYFKNVKYSEYCNSIKNLLIDSELTNIPIKFTETNKATPLTFEFSSWIPEYNDEDNDSNVIVKTNFQMDGKSEFYINADVKNNKLYYFFNGNLEEASKELYFYKVGDFTNKDNTITYSLRGNFQSAKKNIGISPNFGQVINIDVNKEFKLKHSSYDNSYSSYFSVITDLNIREGVDDRAGGWCDCRLDEQLVLGYDIQQ